MNSSTPSSSSAASTSTSQSFHVKPLNLSPTTTLPATSTSPRIVRKTRPPSINVSRRPNGGARRQSSISYIVSPPPTCTSTPQTCGVEWLDNPSVGESPPSRLSRSVSLGNKNVLRGEIRRTPRTGLGLMTADTGESPEDSTPKRPKPPLTSIEKHAELLHVIAQKESICLELRSQLAIHEAELLQLKRKWEIIVARGLDVPHPIGLDRKTSTTPSASSAQNTGTAVVLEGIKEGVQGVSRLILGQPAASPPPSVRPSRPRPRNERPRYSAFDPPASRLSQSSNVSTSSNASSSSSTPTTSTKRTSLSSCASADGENEVAVVFQDTGATPIMSPAPMFKPLLRQAEERNTTQDSVSIDNTDLRDISASSSPSLSAKTLRRRSGGVITSAGLPLLLPHAEETANSPQLSRTGDCHSPPSDKLSKPTSPLPPSSIPGLGSLTSVGMNTVIFGKKLEEGFVKSQKRASLFLSDIVSALSTPTPTTPSPFPSPPASVASAPFSHASAKVSPLSKLEPSPSLLDESDDDTISAGIAGASIMVPEKPQPKSSSVVPEPKLARSSSKKGAGGARTSSLLDDDEWNW